MAGYGAGGRGGAAVTALHNQPVFEYNWLLGKDNGQETVGMRIQRQPDIPESEYRTGA